MDDFIIIGAGPAGNSAAYHLAQGGHNVTVIDRKIVIGDKLCTGIVGAECLEKFPARESSIIKEARSAKFVSPSGIEVEMIKDTTQAYILDRVSYVASIADAAKTTGARYLTRSVTNIEVHRDCVEIATEGDNGTETLKARAIVIASGFGTKFTRKLGLGAIKDFATGTQAEVVAPEQDQVQVYFGQHIAPSFFGWLVPTSPGKALVGLMARHNSRHLLSGFIEQLKAEGKITTISKDPTHWVIPLEPLPRTYGDRLLVAGDAAGQVKPTTGGGIYYSIRAGEIAATSLQKALSLGDFSMAQLRHYEKSWKSLLSRELNIGRSSRTLFETLGDHQIDSLMETIATNGIRSDVLSSKEFSFDWHQYAIIKALGHPLLSKSLKALSPLANRIAARVVSK